MALDITETQAALTRLSSKTKNWLNRTCEAVLRDEKHNEHLDKRDQAAIKECEDKGLVTRGKGTIKIAPVALDLVGRQGFFVDKVPPEVLCADRLAPIRAWAQGNRGSIQELADWITAASGKACNRHMIGRWLRETSPVQPSYGYGLYLEAAYQHLSISK